MEHFEPYVEEKVWGSVQHIFSSDHVGVSCLVVKKRTCCSIHYHDDRFNLFNVLEGVIAVEDFGSKRDDPRRPQALSILHPGDVLTVATDRWHRFRVLESGRVVEVYYPRQNKTVRMDDIVRFDEGGVDHLIGLEEYL